MTSKTTSVFRLPDRLAAKADPALTAADEEHFAAVADSLGEQIADLSQRIDELRLAPAGEGRKAMDRDLEIHRLTANLRVLRRFGVDICLGRMVRLDGSEPLYIGRVGLTNRSGRRLLIDWRAPAAEPFFAATRAEPMGLRSRRRYRWSGGGVSDYWDEALATDETDARAAFDDESAFLATLESSRSARMRDVLSTIQADQDAIIRAGSRGALVVDGGPGTGKTVVALHRAAYLLYSDPRLGHRHGGVLVIGPHSLYLAYVADVLPSLGEEGVQTATVRDLVPEGAAASPEADPAVARLKASVEMVAAIEPAVRLYEEPPGDELSVETYWADLVLGAADWTEAFEAPELGTPHNEARDQVWEALVSILYDQLDDTSVSMEEFRAALAQDDDLTSTFTRAWPLLEPTDLVADLWSVPAYLRRCAPRLDPEQVRLLQRDDPTAWTVSDLPLLDAARHRLGDPGHSHRARRRAADITSQRDYMHQVVDHLIAADHDGESLAWILRQDITQDTLVDTSGLPTVEPDRLTGPFAHIVVDEAQELTDAEWQMVLRRCPSRSLTVVGDRAQARHGFRESWLERLARVGVDRATVATLRLNYRTPAEVMAAAEPVIRAQLPDANVPISVRRGGVPVRYGSTTELSEIVDHWSSSHADGIGCVIGDPTYEPLPRVRSLTPETAKGLEFDLVVLVDPDSFGTGTVGAVDRYVAMTRATSQLVVLTRS